jgi:acyl-CoA thioesterase
MFRDLASGVNYPTICLSMEIKKNPNGKRWLYQRARCHQIQNGRYDMDVYLYDEGGDLVALIKQTSLVAVLTEGKLKDNPDELRKLFKL